MGKLPLQVTGTAPPFADPLPPNPLMVSEQPYRNPDPHPLPNMAGVLNDPTSKILLSLQGRDPGEHG